MVASKLSLVGSLVEGRYLIEEELGGGGMSAVHTARDLKGFGRKVVVKTLLDESRGNEYIVKKFRQEAEALYRVEHPNVVNVLSYGELPDGHPYLVLQFIEGHSLRELVHEGNVELDRCARIIRQIASALSAAHEKGILHRDLKPENVMLQPVGDGEEQVKVIDFGIAKIKDSVIAQETVVVSTAGTISYMSPEQLGAREVTPASDVYALGVIAYELITGRKPFNVESPFQLPEAQRAGVSVKPTQLRPDLPVAAEDDILKALSYEPQDRFPRAREFGDHLYESITGMPAKGTGLLPKGMSGHLRPNTSPLATTPMLDARVTENQTLLRVDTAPESPVAKEPSAPAAVAPPQQSHLETRPLTQPLTQELLQQLPHQQTPQPLPQQQAPQQQVQQQVQQVQSPRVSQPQPVYAGREAVAPPPRSKSWLIPVVAIVALLAVVAAGVGWWMLKPKADATESPVVQTGHTQPTQAREGSTAAKSETLLTYWLTVQRVRGGKEFDQPFPSSGADIFENGWLMRLNVVSPKDGYLYMINDGKDDKGETVLTMLFPNTRTNSLSARLVADQVLETPPGGYFELSGHPETEKVWIVWSAHPVSAVEGVKNVAWQAGSGGEIKDAASASAVRDILSKYDATRVAAEKDSAKKQMNIRGTDDPLIHLVELEHH
jgi:serine/threonine protein kinase